MLLSVKEYAAKEGVSASTVQRRLQRGELKGRKIGRAWFVEMETDFSLVTDGEEQSITQVALPSGKQLAAGRSDVVQDLIGFSSKALNSYLMMSDRLVEEKERVLKAKEEEIRREKQRVAELKSYVNMLEKRLFSDRQIGPSQIKGPEKEEQVTW